MLLAPFVTLSLSHSLFIYNTVFFLAAKYVSVSLLELGLCCLMEWIRPLSVGRFHSDILCWQTQKKMSVWNICLFWFQALMELLALLALGFLEIPVYPATNVPFLLGPI